MGNFHNDLNWIRSRQTSALTTHGDLMPGTTGGVEIGMQIGQGDGSTSTSGNECTGEAMLHEMAPSGE
jgi:hypothetical protein